MSKGNAPRKPKKPPLIWRIYSWFINSTRLGEWAEQKLFDRCDNCPMVGTDWCDYQETGYSEAYCRLGKKEMICFYPRWYRKRKQREADAREAEEETAWAAGLWADYEADLAACAEPVDEEATPTPANMG